MAAFQFIELLFVIRKHVCSKQAGCYCNTKNVCSKQAGDCFLVCKLLTSIILPKCFYYEFYKNFCERCFLVYLANYVNFFRTAVFNLSSK